MTVQGPVKEQQPDGLSHGGGVRDCTCAAVCPGRMAVGWSQTHVEHAGLPVQSGHQTITHCDTHSPVSPWIVLALCWVSEFRQFVLPTCWGFWDSRTPDLESVTLRCASLPPPPPLYKLRQSQINTVPTPTVAWTRA